MDRKVLVSHRRKIRALEIDWIAPSHGPVYDRPEEIQSAYEDWVSERVSSQVVFPYDPEPARRGAGHGAVHGRPAGGGVRGAGGAGRSHPGEARKLVARGGCATARSAGEGVPTGTVGTRE